MKKGFSCLKSHLKRFEDCGLFSADFFVGFFQQPFAELVLGLVVVLATDIEVKEEDCHAIEYMPEAVGADAGIFTAEYLFDIHLKEDTGYRNRNDTGYEVIFVGLAGPFDFEVYTCGDDQQDDTGYDGLDEVVTIQEECQHSIDGGEYGDHNEATFGAFCIGGLALKGEDDAMREIHSREERDAING